MAHYVGSARDGQRARHGANEQEARGEALEKMKAKLRADTEAQISSISDKFLEDTTMKEQMFKASVQGLQTNAEYRQKEALFADDSKDLVQATEEADLIDQIKYQQELENIALSKNRKKRKKNKKKAMLSFDDDFEEEFVPLKKKAKKNNKKRNKNRLISEKKLGKNPSIDTSFLPDAERDAKDEELREQFRKEWHQEQERIKDEQLTMTFAYYDGSGHRRTTTIKKGESINDFLESARKTLAPHFSDLRGLHGSSLMFIKDELIIPHSYTFYDLIVTKAFGPNGALFKLDPYEKHQKDITPPGKVITRSWYERNKHIYPASRWDTYDPSLHTEAYRKRKT